MNAFAGKCQCSGRSLYHVDGVVARRGRKTERVKSRPAIDGKGAGEAAVSEERARGDKGGTVLVTVNVPAYRGRWRGADDIVANGAGDGQSAGGTVIFTRSTPVYCTGPKPVSVTVVPG